jgi:hypothetical protein
VSLRDLAKAPATGPRWQECGVHYALRTLPTSEADALRDALALDHVPHQAIADELNALYVAVEAPAVGRHRAGRCKCDACACPVCAA